MARTKRAVKTEVILIRMTRAQKRALTAAARRAGLPVSSWLRAVGIEQAGKRVATDP